MVKKMINESFGGDKKLQMNSPKYLYTETNEGYSEQEIREL